jgi:CRP-like cAMP-binding protein
LRAVAVTDRPTVEVIGAGDLFRLLEQQQDPNAIVSGEVRWWALRPARVAVLDASFARSMSDYPGVVAELTGRLLRRSAASSLRLAIVQEPRLSVRLHCLLWQLADRFGEPQGEGMLVKVPLCHVLLSWLVGARRPAMSRAINELERAGQLARRPDGMWWLGRQRPEGFGQLTRVTQPVAA